MRKVCPPLVLVCPPSGNICTLGPSRRKLNLTKDIKHIYKIIIALGCHRMGPVATPTIRYWELSISWWDDQRLLLLCEHDSRKQSAEKLTQSRNRVDPGCILCHHAVQLFNVFCILLSKDSDNWRGWHNDDIQQSKYQLKACKCQITLVKSMWFIHTYLRLSTWSTWKCPPPHLISCAWSSKEQSWQLLGMPVFQEIDQFHLNWIRVVRLVNSTYRLNEFKWLCRHHRSKDLEQGDELTFNSSI